MIIYDSKSVKKDQKIALIWCHYITLGVIFSHLVELTGHFKTINSGFKDIGQ